MERREGATDDAQTAGTRPALWTDRKRRLWLLAFVVPALPLMAWGLATLLRSDVWWYWGLIFVFAVLPLADLLVGSDSSNPPDEIARALQADPWYRWIVLCYLPLQYLVGAWAVWYVIGHDMSGVSLVGLAITVGIVHGIGINAAHELGHKSEKLEHWASKLALAPSLYGHFFVEHNWGHHKWVATPDDPATSRLGEGFYRFWPRTVCGSLRSAWAIESRRLRRRGARVLSRHNRVLHAWSLSALLWAAAIGAAVPGRDWRVLPFLALSAVVGFTLLEAVNYVEHYGLLRERDESGRYERVRPVHSWNNDHVVTNLFLYQLQRHSDHHENPNRRFVALRHVDEAPQLPAGYATMILVALVPPLWRRVMDPRLAAHYGGDLRRANTGPEPRPGLRPRAGRVRSA